jgi:ABC-type amino acid transport system permease subunit
LFGELEQLLKSTSLLATIGVTELTRTGMNIISRELNPLPVYLAIAIIYLLFSVVLSGITIYAERRMHYGYR